MSLPVEPEYVESGALARFDTWVAALVLRVPASLRPAMWFATAFGYPVVEAVPLLVVALLWDGPLRAAALVLAASLFLPRVIKHTVRRKRPASEYVAAMRMAGPSFPSGHAYSAVAATSLYGYLAVTRLEPVAAVAVVLLCVVWVLWVSLSRLFFRAHYASDIVGGWVIGAAVAALVLVVTTP